MPHFLSFFICGRIKDISLTIIFMVYRIAAGVFFLLLGLTDLGLDQIPAFIIAVAALVAGIALLAGF